MTIPRETVQRRDVEFAAHDGTILRGWFYPGQAPLPTRALVMAHGFSATIGMALDDFAERFARAGIACLVYDHRNLGQSDGTPRQLIDAFVQSRDMLAAVDWLAACDGVDPARIGIWGSSYAGGIVQVVGALHPQVRAVVANVPFAGRPAEAAGTPAEAFARLEQAVRTAVGDPATMRGPFLVVPEDGREGTAIMPQDDAREWFHAAATPCWRNEAWLPDLEKFATFDPAVAVPHCHGPVLYVVAEADLQAPAPVARKTFALAPPGSEFLTVPGHHFTPYSGECLDRVAAATADFLLRML